MPMLGGSEKTTLFLGNYGSGKTEVSVNFALHLAGQLEPGSVTLVDLDLVNPYFRSREPKEVLERAGVRVVVPDGKYTHADLPILVPAVRGALRGSTGHVILDVGGDDVGARVLGALRDGLPEGSYRALMVLNGSRPFTGDVAGVERIRKEIELAGRISVTGLVSNTHLMEATTLETVLAGVELAAQVEAKSGLPLEFVTAPLELVDKVRDATGREVMPLYRFLSVPWRNPLDGIDNLGRELFRL